MSSTCTNTPVDVGNTLYLACTYLYRKWEFQRESLTGVSTGDSDMFRPVWRARVWDHPDLFTWGPEMVYTWDNGGACWDRGYTPQEEDHLALGKKKSLCLRGEGLYAPWSWNCSLGCKGELSLYSTRMLCRGHQISSVSLVPVTKKMSIFPRVFVGQVRV